jgi:hypothetical protein
MSSGVVKCLHTLLGYVRLTTVYFLSECAVRYSLCLSESILDKMVLFQLNPTSFYQPVELKKRRRVNGDHFGFPVTSKIAPIEVV